MKERNFKQLLYHFYAIFTVFMVFWIYMKTLAPTVSFFDSGELISAAYTLGVAHPPGYPLYVLLGWFFSKLPIGSGAFRINLMSAFFASFAALMVYYLTYTVLTSRLRPEEHETPGGQPDPERMLYPVVSLIAAMTFAFSITQWQHAVIAEVYTLNAFLCGLILLLLILWRDRFVKATSAIRQPAVNTWMLYLIALIFGLGFGNHQTISLLFFAACFVVLITIPRVIFQYKTILLILLSLMLGMSIYLLVPIRAAHNPPINWGNPVTLHQMKWLVTREGYDNVPRGHALTSLWHEVFQNDDAASKDAENTQGQPTPRQKRSISQIIRQSLFFRQLKTFHPLQEFGYMGVILSIVGLIYGLVRHPVMTATMLIAVASLVFFTIFVSDPPEENVFLVEEFHTPSYLILAVWIGMGAMAITRGALWVASPWRKVQYVLVFLLAMTFLVPPGNQMLKNLLKVDRRRNYVAYDYATNVMNSLKPNAILFTWGDSGAFPLWYLQIVEKQRQDVTLIHVPHLATEWYIQSLPKELFISENPYQEHQGDVIEILNEIVHKYTFSRPVYFDYSSTHSLMLPYRLVPNGITYKVQKPGDTIDETIWDRYTFRGILDNTRIAMDPDIERTFSMYGSAHVELGHYYLELDQLEKAAKEFNAAVQFDPAFGDRIVQSLEFRNKLTGQRPMQTP